MQDFTLSCYEKSLWIKELQTLQRWNSADSHDKRYRINTGAKEEPVGYFSIFGTVVDVLHKPDTEFKLYTIDDGTGTMVCKQFLTGEINSLNDLEDWSWGDATNASKTYGRTTTMCDTVFNDRTIQQEEKDAINQARRRVLESLRWSIVNSFRSSEGIEVGDSACVHGRLYTYFNINQIHVNTIRLITVQEELVLMRRKLEDSKCRLGRNTTDTQVNPSQVVDSEGSSVANNSDEGVQFLRPGNFEYASLPVRRASGLMTFDNVVESQLASARAQNISHVSLPPSPRPMPGLLASQPVVSEMPPPFDTYFVEEVSGSSSSDDDQLIPPTPQAKRSKTQ